MTFSLDLRGGQPPSLLHDLLLQAAARWPERVALIVGDRLISYGQLAARMRMWQQALQQSGCEAGQRVAVVADKDEDVVAAMFAVSAAQAVLVPINPVLKPAQIQHILADCNVSHVVCSAVRVPVMQALISAEQCLIQAHHLPDVMPATLMDQTMADSDDLVAIFYTSGSTGKAKGVMLSHRNLVTGAISVASYLKNDHHDTLLAVLPLSFDAGFSQLTTAFHVGARVVLLNYLLPSDAIQAMAKHGVTGITAVPPLYAQLVKVTWPSQASQRLRYWANTGGHMPLALLKTLRERAPHAAPYLMFGLTEAFRATYLDPAEVDRRPDSIGKAIPGAVVRVLREDGTFCSPDELGELVQAGDLVAQGYWERPEETALRFKSLPPALRAEVQATLPGAQTNLAVYSGDTAKCDAEGFIYFVGRRDDMIKTSGYRVSPNEIEEVALACDGVHEAVAVGVPDENLGQFIRLVVHVSSSHQAELASGLAKRLKQQLPAYMVPREIIWQTCSLPRNPNGKYDRQVWRNDARI